MKIEDFIFFPRITKPKIDLYFKIYNFLSHNLTINSFVCNLSCSCKFCKDFTFILENLRIISFIINSKGFFEDSDFLATSLDDLLHLNLSDCSYKLKSYYTNL